jgi:aquaporin PIP
MSVSDGAAFIAAQCLGAIFGAAIVFGGTVSPTLIHTGVDGATQPPFKLGSNIVSPDLNLASAFLAEGMGTFLLVWTVMMTAVHKKSIAQNLAPIIIGFSVLLAHLVLIPLTGCGINPARSLGPHLAVIISGTKIGFEGWWIYYTAPFVGAAFAAFLAKTVFGLDDDADEGGNAEEVDEEKVAVKSKEYSE